MDRGVLPSYLMIFSRREAGEFQVTSLICTNPTENQFCSWFLRLSSKECRKKAPGFVFISDCEKQPLCHKKTNKKRNQGKGYQPERLPSDPPKTSSHFAAG